MKRLEFLSALMASSTLAACSGGGGGTAIPPVTTGATGATSTGSVVPLSTAVAAAKTDPFANLVDPPGDPPSFNFQRNGDSVVVTASKAFMPFTISWDTSGITVAGRKMAWSSRTTLASGAPIAVDNKDGTSTWQLPNMYLSMTVPVPLWPNQFLVMQDSFLLVAIAGSGAANHAVLASSVKAAQATRQTLIQQRGTLSAARQTSDCAICFSPPPPSVYFSDPFAPFSGSGGALLTPVIGGLPFGFTNNGFYAGPTKFPTPAPLPGVTFDACALTQLIGALIGTVGGAADIALAAGLLMQNTPMTPILLVAQAVAIIIGVITALGLVASEVVMVQAIINACNLPLTGPLDPARGGLPGTRSPI